MGMLRDGIVDHHRVAAVFLLVLGSVNGWISYTIFAAHPHLALLHAALAAILVVGVYLT